MSALCFCSVVSSRASEPIMLRRTQYHGPAGRACVGLLRWHDTCGVGHRHRSSRGRRRQKEEGCGVDGPAGCWLLAVWLLAAAALTITRRFEGGRPWPREISFDSGIRLGFSFRPPWVSCMRELVVGALTAGGSYRIASHRRRYATGTTTLPPAPHHLTKATREDLRE